MSKSVLEAKICSMVAECKRRDGYCTADGECKFSPVCNAIAPDGYDDEFSFAPMDWNIEEEYK